MVPSPNKCMHAHAAPLSISRYRVTATPAAGVGLHFGGLPTARLKVRSGTRTSVRNAAVGEHREPGPCMRKEQQPLRSWQQLHC
jgi:hypothetical protein